MSYYPYCLQKQPFCIKTRGLSALQLSYNVNINSLDTAVALGGVKSNLLTIFQSLVAISYDTGEVYERFFAAICSSNEAKTLRLVERLNLTLIFAI